MDSITPEAANANAHESGRRKSAAAAIRYKVSRRIAYKRRKRHDETPESLKGRSRAPRRNVRRRRRRGHRSCAMRVRIQSADKAHNRKDRADILKNPRQFLLPAVTYAHASSLGCNYSFLACGLLHRFVGPPTLSTSCTRHAKRASFFHISTPCAPDDFLI